MIIKEYIIKKEDYKIKVQFEIIADYNKFEILIQDIKILYNKKRKWISLKEELVYPNLYKYKSFNDEEKQNFLKEEYSKYISEEELFELTIECFKSLTPEKIFYNTNYI